MGKYICFEVLKQIVANIYHKKYIMLIDAPLLYETRALEYLCFPVVVVGCPESVQIQRLAKRNNYSEE
jgi:dephospho-CoA kinase